MREGMRSTRRTLRRPSVLPKTQRNGAAISNTFHYDMEKRNPYQS